MWFKYSEKRIKVGKFSFSEFWRICGHPPLGGGRSQLLISLQVMIFISNFPSFHTTIIFTLSETLSRYAIITVFKYVTGCFSWFIWKEAMTQLAPLSVLWTVVFCLFCWHVQKGLCLQLQDKHTTMTNILKGNQLKKGCIHGYFPIITVC